MLVHIYRACELCDGVMGNAHLVGDGVEEGGLVGSLEVLDRVVVYKDAAGRDGEGGDAVWTVSWIDLRRCARTWVGRERRLRRGRDCSRGRRPGRFRDLGRRGRRSTWR
jgi:hypothetical protein